MERLGAFRLATPVLEIHDLCLGYDDKIVVSDFCLTVEEGKFVSLLGPSGCGKSTVLRAIAGFLKVKSGKIFLEGADITRLPPEVRDIGMVFQNYALFPTMTVFENIAFGLRAAGRRADEVKQKVTRIADTAGISQHLYKKPASLSGGEQQRVAIARALVMGSRVLLLDEPLSNLDAKVRIAMRREIKRLQREIGFTAIFVTHDQEEALSMSDAIVVLNMGNIEQIGTARELYERPANPFIASFIGAANELPTGLANRLTGAAEGRCFVKHEDLLISEDGEPGIVCHVEFLGPVTRVDLDVRGYVLSSLQFGGRTPALGERVNVSVRPGTASFYDGSWHDQEIKS